MRRVVAFVLLVLFAFSERAWAETAADALARVRSDPALASDARAVDELVRVADASPPGLVRVECWTLAAEAYARRLARPADAERLYRVIVAEPGADPVLVRNARTELVRMLLARGDRAGAAAAADGDARLAAEVARADRRQWLHLASISLVALVALLTGRALVSAARRDAGGAVRRALRRIAPVALAFAAYVAIAGGVLATRFENGTARPFLVLGGAVFALALVARAWAAAGATTRPARIARAAFCAASALGAAFLVLESVDVAYLEGMGL